MCVCVCVCVCVCLMFKTCNSRKKLHVAMNDGIVPTAVEESESNV